MINNRITVIPRIFKTSVVQDVKLKDVLGVIKTGCANGQDLKGTTRMIQAELDHSKQNKMKYEMLPVALFNGTFSYKNDQSLKEYSSFTAIDLDNFGSQNEMYNTKNLLMKDNCVYAIFTTPSGRGLKAIIIHDNLSPDYHGELYEQLLAKFRLSVLDSSVSDLSRGNYICYDPELYVNKNCIPFHFAHDPNYIPPKNNTGSINRGIPQSIESLRLMLSFKHPVGNKSDESIIEILNSYWKKQPDRWRIGNRKNSVFYSASELCNNGVNMDKALDYLVKAYTKVGLEENEIVYQAIRGYQCNAMNYGVNRSRFDGYGSRR